MVLEQGRQVQGVQGVQGVQEVRQEVELFQEGRQEELQEAAAVEAWVEQVEEPE